MDFTTRQPTPPGPDKVGDWRLVARLGEGGFGSVWRAEGPDGARAAVKILHPELVASAEQVGRFRREAEAIAALRHRHVVELLEQGELANGRPYLVMELLEGEDLASLLARRGALPLAEAVAILEGLCGALEAAHAQGIVHRDLKPSNVVLTDRGAVLLDFGLAKLLEGQGPELTASRCVLGTPACMAPEQICGDPVTPRTDVYGLGALTFEMLAGAPPFADASPITLGYLHLHGRRPRPGDRVPLPPAIDEAIVRAMDRDPDSRWPSASAFLDELRRPLGAAVAGGSRIAARVELAGPAERMADPDDALLEALDAGWDRVAAGFEDAGFTCLGERGEVAIFVAASAGGDVAGTGELAAAIERAAGEAGREIAVRIAFDVVPAACGVDELFSRPWTFPPKSSDQGS
jgi:serine/threonine-protein kinase